MPVLANDRSDTKLAISSCTRTDVWHGHSTAGAYEWWYFDAMSDDGTEAVVIWFLDNSVFSPRYNRNLRYADDPDASSARFPAVLFAYYKGGKCIYRTFCEYSASDMTAETDSPGCTIGDSSFRFDSVPYGSGYEIQIRSPLSRGRRLDAHFEWLLVESDLKSSNSDEGFSGHSWNVVTSRSDVSGRINISDKRRTSGDVRHFRGTGYHDHESDLRGFAGTISEKNWGRVHFPDSTAIFQVFAEANCSHCAKLLIVKDGRLIEMDADFEQQNFVRDKFGIKYPTRLTLTTDDNIRLRVKPVQVLDSSFYSLRFASEMTLNLRDGKPRRSTGISELLAPRTLKYRWLDWLTDMRIEKKGKGELL